MELDYRTLVQKAQSYIQQGDNLEEAKRILNALLTDYIDDNEHSFYLIAMLSDLELRVGNLGLGMVLIKQALAIKPDYFPALNNLGFAYKNLGNIEKCQEAFSETVQYIDTGNYNVDDEDKAYYYANLGSSYIANGTPERAMKEFNKALALVPEHPHARFNKSLAYLEMGNYEEGFELMDSGERIQKRINRNYMRPELPFWDGTPGKNVVVFGEQGIGDEIMFASMLPDLMRECNVILDAHIRLKYLFHNSFPGLHIYGTREGPDVPWAIYENIDCKIAIGSLGKFYRKKKEDFPGTSYLMANDELVAKYAKKLRELSDKPKIGISWMGGLVNTNKKSRKIDMEMLLPLLQTKEFDFISLQYNKGIGDKVRKFEQKHNVQLNHWQDMLDDYDETAGLVSNLDLIISVPQSVVHLAGALGVHCIQMCPKKALWQMGPYGQNMPWYSCVENIWQEEEGNWQPVIAKAKEKLCNLLVKNTEN